MKPFVHLHLHTEYSLLDGATKISKIFKACKERNFPAVAITDHGNMHGVVAFVSKAKDYNKENPDFPVKPILGCEFYVVDDLYDKSSKVDRGHLILLAKTQEGYFNLVKLNSIAYVDGFYYKPRIDYKTLKKYSKGLVCLTACIAGDVQSYLLKGMDDEAEAKAKELMDMFEPGDFYMELQDQGLAEQKKIIPKQIALANKLGIKCVVTNDVHYLNKDDAEMQDVMMCINMGRKLDDVDRLKMPCDEFYMKTYDELLEVFSYIPEALDNTLEIAEKCDATVLFGQDLSPAYTCPGDEMDPKERLRKMTYEGARERYGEPLSQKVIDRIEHELNIICSMGYADYFLIVWDFIRYCHEVDIPVGPGRGSAAGSIVAYCMNITKLDPLKYDLIFERFLNPDRISMPDIDTDFEGNRRLEVVDYVSEKYGPDHVCQIATFGRMKAKAAIKDVARVLNMPYSEVDKITKAMPLEAGDYEKDAIRKMFGVEVTGDNVKLAIPELKQAYEENAIIKRIVNLAIRLEGMPRNVSTHAAGVVICNRPIGDAVPLARTGDDILTQFDWRECEKIGTLKMDFLGLKTLTDLKGTTDMVKELYGIDIDFYSKDFSYNDPKVFNVIASGNTDAIFQLESGGMKQFMKELKPESMEDIVAGIAIYRPGPMGIIPDFLACKRDPSKITYMLPELEPILKNTYGFIVYQEQVMQIVQSIAGYSLAQGDDVRKMMGKKLVDKIVKERQTFLYGRDDPKHPIKGAVANGVSEEIANKLWDSMETFGRYGFNKSHSAGYAYVAYQTAFLKCYYEEPFIASVLNTRIDKSDEIKKYIAHAKERNIKVLPPDINVSSTMFTVEGKDIRYGLAALKGVGVLITDEIVAERKKNGPYKDLYDYISRSGSNAINKRVIESFILSGAFDCFGVKRSQLMQVYSEIVEQVLNDRKNQASGQFSFFEQDLGENIFQKVDYPNIPEFSTQVKLKYEKEVLGTYLSGHPLEDHASKFANFNLTSDMLVPVEVEEQFIDEEAGEVQMYEGDVKDGMAVTCGGIISEVKKVFTKAANREMAILKIEDLVGNIDVMVFPNVYEKIKPQLTVDTLLTIKGKLSLNPEKGATVLCEKIEVWERANEIELPSKIEEEQEVAKQASKTLYLKYSTLDDYVALEVNNFLVSLAGECPVVIKCSETGKAFKSSLKVTISDALLMELKGVLNDSCVVVK